jgi:hypothetical protein
MTDAQEIENTADDGQWWQIIADWMEDISAQDVPGSVVILIVVVAFVPMLIRAFTGFLKWRSGGR